MSFVGTSIIFKYNEYIGFVNPWCLHKMHCCWLVFVLYWLYEKLEFIDCIYYISKSEISIISNIYYDYINSSLIVYCDLNNRKLNYFRIREKVKKIDLLKFSFSILLEIHIFSLRGREGVNSSSWGFLLSQVDYLAICSIPK